MLLPEGWRDRERGVEGGMDGQREWAEERRDSHREHQDF